jgi:hypothetical protein
MRADRHAGAVLGREGSSHLYRTIIPQSLNFSKKEKRPSARCSCLSSHAYSLQTHGMELVRTDLKDI